MFLNIVIVTIAISICRDEEKVSWKRGRLAGRKTGNKGTGNKKTRKRGTGRGDSQE